MAVIEQALMSLGSFAASWAVTRHLGVKDIADFFLVWTWGWGILAVLSESVIVPTRVAILRDGREPADALNVIQLMRNTAFLLLLVSIPLPYVPELILLGVATALAAAAMLFARLLDRDQVGPNASLRRMAIFSISSAGLLLLLITTKRLTATSALAAADLSMIISAVIIRDVTPPTFTTKRTRLALIAIWTTLQRSYPFGISTGIRFVLYSGALLTWVRSDRGIAEAALFSTIFVIASPMQLLSSTLPIVLMPQLARAASQSREFLVAWLRQGALYLLVAVAASTTLAVFFHPWLGIVVGSPQLQASAQDSMWAVVLLIFGVVVSSWTASAAQALSRPFLSLTTSVVGGGIALGLAVGGLSTRILPSTPYLAACLLGVAGTLLVLQRRSREQL